jgi:hypothetical protein
MKKIIILSLIPVLLFTQGLRLCIHDLGGQAPHGKNPAQAAAIHLESTQTAPGDDDPVSNQHAQLSVILKHFDTKLAFLVILAVVLILLPFQRFTRTVWRREPLSAIASGYSLKQRPRAPPR